MGMFEGARAKEEERKPRAENTKKRAFLALYMYTSMHRMKNNEEEKGICLLKHV
jgi:hypothetical protein